MLLVGGGDHNDDGDDDNWMVMITMIAKLMMIAWMTIASWNQQQVFNLWTWMIENVADV